MKGIILKKIYIVCVIDVEKLCFNFDLYLEFFVYWVSKIWNIMINSYIFVNFVKYVIWIV